MELELWATHNEYMAIFHRFGKKTTLVLLASDTAKRGKMAFEHLAAIVPDADCIWGIESFRQLMEKKWNIPTCPKSWRKCYL